MESETEDVLWDSQQAIQRGREPFLCSASRSLVSMPGDYRSNPKFTPAPASPQVVLLAAQPSRAFLISWPIRSTQTHHTECWIP